MTAVQMNEMKLILNFTSVMLHHDQRYRLFLFKFRQGASDQANQAECCRKVLKFWGNINSVLLHITCHPGSLGLEDD